MAKAAASTKLKRSARKNKTPNIRPLQPADLASIVGIDRAATGRSRRMFFEKRLLSAGADPTRYITLGAELNGKLVGHATARVNAGEFGSGQVTVELETIGVDPSVQRGGIGQALLHAIEREAGSRGAQVVATQVDWSNSSLLAFFARTGFSLAPYVLLERDPRALTPGERG